MIENRINYDKYSQEYIHGFYVVETTFRVLQFVNNVANFFCYCISGRRFRTELVVMVKGWFGIKETQQDSNLSRSFSTISSRVTDTHMSLRELLIVRLTDS